MLEPTGFAGGSAANPLCRQSVVPDSYYQIMPIISSFFGIIVRMYYKEHGAPHIHAEYQGQFTVFAFDGTILAGSIQSGTARRLIREWLLAHSPELESNWNRARLGEQLQAIAPLE